MYLALSSPPDPHLAAPAADYPLGAGQVLLRVDVEGVHRRLADDGAPRPDLEAVVHGALDHDIAGEGDIARMEIHFALDEEDLVDVGAAVLDGEPAVHRRDELVVAALDIAAGHAALRRFARVGRLFAAHVHARRARPLGHMVAMVSPALTINSVASSRKSTRWTLSST